MDPERLRLLRRLGITIVAVMALGGTLMVVFTLMTRQMGTLAFALIVGALGAEISIVRRVPALTKPEISALVGSWWSLLVPLLTGSVMAAFLYVAFMAGILTGDGGGGLFTSNLFPNFRVPEEDDVLNMRIVLEIRPTSITDFGKLMAWCFLSGYSERLVPNLLQSLEQRGSSSDPS